MVGTGVENLREEEKRDIIDENGGLPPAGGPPFTRFTVWSERDPQGPGPPFNGKPGNGRISLFNRGFYVGFRRF